MTYGEDGDKHKWRSVTCWLGHPCESEFADYLSCGVSLCYGVDAKQARVRVRGIEGCGLKDIRRQTVDLKLR